MGSNKLRKSARGRHCQIRIQGICNHNPETVVLCHLPGGGMGAKVSDMQGAYGCYACHAAVDGHMKTDFSRDELELCHRRGVQRTQEIMEKEGLIKI